MDLEQTFRDILNIQQTALAEGARLARATQPQQPEAGTVAAAFKAQDSLRAVIAAYDKALLDEEAKLPTTLHCALEAARRWA